MVKLSWNDESEGFVNKKLVFRINPMRDIETGATSWFLSEGPLDQAPAPSATLDDAKELAQAIVDGKEGGA